ncbi:hypothetical protein NC981_22675 [Leptolyngbya sp. DQ-M1]|uniref:hypothetical protein n=1 Tax=Leptolyngbya sp. DQ-M1 TaxID=2933920 RepID=UPI003296E11C
MSTRKSTNGTSNGNGSGVPAKLRSALTTSTPVTFLSETSLSADVSSLSQINRDEILQLLTLLRDKLPPLRDLTAEERRSLSGMGDKNRSFAGKVLEVILQDPDFLPRSFDVNQYQRDLATFDDLSTIALALTRLLDLVNATATAIGSEVYDDALSAYRYAKASGQGASLEAMMTEMKQRFAQQGKKKDKEAEKPKVKE